MLNSYNQLDNTITDNYYVLTVGNLVVDISKDKIFKFLNRPDIEHIKKNTYFHTWVIYGPNGLKENIFTTDRPMLVEPEGGSGETNILGKIVKFKYMWGMIG